MQPMCYATPLKLESVWANLEVIFEEPGVEAEDGQIRGISDRLLQLIDHPGVERDRVEETEERESQDSSAKQPDRL